MEEREKEKKKLGEDLPWEGGGRGGGERGKKGGEGWELEVEEEEEMVE